MKILFICHYNKCLSPLAEGILLKKIKEKGADIHVESAGFELFHVNECPEKKAIKLAKKHDVDISDIIVRIFSSSDFDEFDHIYILDSVSYREIMFFARNEEDKKKVDFLMNLLVPGENRSIVDPFYLSLEKSESTFSLIEQACDKILEFAQQK